MTEIEITRLLKSNDVLSRKLAGHVSDLDGPAVHYMFGLPLDEVAKIIDEHRNPLFATEAGADAYLAGETAEAPKFPEVGSSFDFIRQDGTWIKVRVAPDAPAPKPVTWPDGVTKMTIGPHQITIDAETGVIQVVWHGSVGSTPAQARQLAALLLAAADKVEGR